MVGSVGRGVSRRDDIVSSPEKLCPMCLRVRRLSGEKKCAIHVKADFLAAHHPEFDLKSIAGSSPPGVFVGRFGYPNVSIDRWYRRSPATLRFSTLQNGGWARASMR